MSRFVAIKKTEPNSIQFKNICERIIKLDAIQFDELYMDIFAFGVGKQLNIPEIGGQ
jgi:hypothetical protein